jgi:cell cycle sensor histidine kinase DivJ
LGGRPALAAWHAAWAVAAALLALGGRWLGDVDGPVFWGVLAMVVPGLAGLSLLQQDGPTERVALLGVWSLAALLAGSLSGGLTGPLASFVFLPLAAGLALGGVRLVQGGALAGGFAALAGLFSAGLAGAGEPSPGLASASAVLTAGACISSRNRAPGTPPPAG